MTTGSRSCVVMSVHRIQMLVRRWNPLRGQRLVHGLDRLLILFWTIHQVVLVGLCGKSVIVPVVVPQGVHASAVAKTHAGLGEPRVGPQSFAQSPLFALERIGAGFE